MNLILAIFAILTALLVFSALAVEKKPNAHAAVVSFVDMCDFQRGFGVVRF